jgi:hypothetical protein
MKKILSLLAVLLFFLLLPLSFSQASLVWTQSNTDGFDGVVGGNRETDVLAAYNSKLYAGTYNPSGAQLWEYDGSWSMILDFSTTDSNNTNIESMAVYDSLLYFGVTDAVAGGEVWTYDGVSTFGQETTNGFGDSGNTNFRAMAVYNNVLYVGSTNFGGAQIFSYNGSSWSGSSLIGDGFGDTNNVDISFLATYDSNLYAGTSNSFVGTQVYVYGGSTWTKSNDDGFGAVDGSNTESPSAVVYNDKLYVGTASTMWGTRGEIWSFDGSIWSGEDINNGFDNEYNESIRSLITYGNGLYAATAQSFGGGGGEVWVYNGSSWGQVNSDGFGDVGNEDILASVEYDSKLYFGTGGFVGTEIWELTDDSDPAINGQNPADAASDVSRDSNIYFELDDADLGIDSSSLTVTIGGTAAISTGSCQTGYACTIAQDGFGYNVTINPDTDFSYDASVTVDVSVDDYPGNNGTDSWTFTIGSESGGDSISPTISNRSPASLASDVARNTNIYFELDDDSSGVDSSSLTTTVGGNTAITNGSCQTGYSCTITADGSGGYNITINPDSDFSYDASVSIGVSVEDISNNALTSSWTFTIESEEQDGDDTDEDTNEEQPDQEGNIELIKDPKILTTSGPGETTRLWAYDRHGNVTDVKINEGLFPKAYLGGAGIIPIDQNHNGVKDQFVIFALNQGGPQARVFGLRPDGTLVFKGQMFLFQNSDDEVGTSSIRDGLSMTSGDFDNDGYEDDIAACLTGDYSPRVKVFRDAMGVDDWELINQFDAPYGANGCNLGTFQYDDGATELLVTPHHGPSVDPMVYIYTVGGTLKNSFQAYDDSIQEGLTASGIGDRIYTTPNNGTSHVRVFDKEGSPKNFWWAYPEETRGNFRNISGDIDLDGKDEILISPIGANGPHILSFEATGKLRTWPNFFAFDQTLRDGVSVAVIENWHGVN